MNHEGIGICGVDEAGRGPLAGSVFAAAVILPEINPIIGLQDSKKLSAHTREKLAIQIKTAAIAYCVASASVAEIDEMNILQATMLAMQRAVAGLKITPEKIWVDGNRCPVWSYQSEAIIKGDVKVPAISAASILAKVSKDAEAQVLAVCYPEYGFDQHKGYGTAFHLTALKQYGPCAAHRKSFAPVRAAYAQQLLI
jgi:ribonuclease HII